MKHPFQSDLTKTLLYFILTLAATAALAPWPYNLGKMITEVVEARNTGDTAQGIAGWCARAEFSHFFLLSFLGCALVLAGPFICWMRFGSGDTHPPVRPWSLRLPHPGLTDAGQPLRPNPRKAFHWLTGFLLAGSLLALMNWLLLLTGWFSFSQPVNWLPAMTKSLTIAVISGMLLEWVFRGAFLGILLRSLRPTLAIAGVSTIYACLHFLFPHEKFHLSDAGEPNAGFRFIAESARHLSANPDDVFGFITLFFSGLILAYTRYRTASLSLALGLQTGWLFVSFLSWQIITFAPTHYAKIEFIIGPDRRSGLLPLCILTATGLLIHVFIQISTRDKTAP